jgi:hypothetical protein
MFITVGNVINALLLVFFVGMLLGDEMKMEGKGGGVFFVFITLGTLLTFFYLFVFFVEMLLGDEMDSWRRKVRKGEVFYVGNVINILLLFFFAGMLLGDEMDKR